MDPNVKLKEGGSLTSCSPVFSSDEKYIFVPWRKTVVCYSTKTAKRVQEYKGLKHNVIGLSLLNLKGNDHIFACSSAGEIISWNVNSTFASIKSKISLKNISVRKFYTISWDEEQETKQRHLLSWTLPKSESNLSLGIFDSSNRKLKELKLTLEDKDHQLAVGGSGNPIFALVQGRRLYFGRLKEGRHMYKHGIHGRTFTCVACHPHEESVLTGDNTGRILIWNALTTSTPAWAVYHWHNLPVKSLCFSRSGSYFFSGAAECVLVKWNLEDPGNKQFLPRLSSTIEHITVSESNALIAVTTSDNISRILDSKFDQVSSIQHLVLGRQFPAGLHFEPRTESIVLNGIIGHIQFYFPNDRSLLYNLDVVRQNKLTNERDLVIANTDVVKIATDKCGKWLATIEERQESNLHYDLRLKFWLFNFKEQQYQLNTSVDLPHENTVNDISFQPVSNDKELRCVTVGGDKKFKIWELVNVDTVHKKGVQWKCSAIGFYKELPCKALDFSSDGSVFGVSFDFIVTIWDSETCELKYSFSSPQIKQEVTHIKFGAADQCHLLVSANKHQIVLWNLLMLNMEWIVNVNVSLLISNNILPYMAVFTTNNKLIIFNPSKRNPVYVNDKLLNDGSEVLGATFVPHSVTSDVNDDWYNQAQLYFITSNQELYCFESNKDVEDNNETADTENKSLFNIMTPKLKSGHQTRQEDNYRTNKYTNIKKIKEFLDIPVNTMAPLHLTCNSVLKTLVESNIKNSEISDYCLLFPKEINQKNAYGL